MKSWRSAAGRALRERAWAPMTADEIRRVCVRSSNAWSISPEPVIGSWNIRDALFPFHVRCSTVAACSVELVAASSIAAPVRLPLTTLVSELEEAVPNRFGGLDDRIEIPDRERTAIAFELTRSPFRVTLVGDVARLEPNLAAVAPVVLRDDGRDAVGVTGEDRSRMGGLDACPGTADVHL